MYRCESWECIFKYIGFSCPRKLPGKQHCFDLYTFVHIKMKQQCLFLCPKSWVGRVSGCSYLADLQYLDVMLSKWYILTVQAYLWLCENPENSNRKNTIFLIFTPTESLNFSCKIYLNSLKLSNYFFFFSYRGL